MGDFGYAMLTVVLSLSVVVGLAVAIFLIERKTYLGLTAL